VVEGKFEFAAYVMPLALFHVMRVQRKSEACHHVKVKAVAGKISVFAAFGWCDRPLKAVSVDDAFPLDLAMMASFSLRLWVDGN
jgi:hypothetical protein